MDPDEARRRLNERLDRVAPDPDDLDEIAELWRALDNWLSGGGFLPAAWER